MAVKKRTDVIIYGASGHGKVIADMIDGREDLRLLGFVDDGKWKLGEKKFYGRPILGDMIYALSAKVKAGTCFVMGIGDNAVRRKLVFTLDKKVRWIAVVDAHAVISDSAVIGEGAVIMPGAIINAEAMVGKHVIVNTGATIDHDCHLGDFSHIAPGVHMAGDVRVGEGSLIGIGSSVRQGVNIGRHTTIGAGSAVVSNIPGRSVAYGVPAKIMRESKS